MRSSLLLMWVVVFSGNAAWAATDLFVGKDARNARVESLVPTQKIVGYRMERNPKACMQQDPDECFTIVEVPIWEKQIELKITYQSALDGNCDRDGTDWDLPCSSVTKSVYFKETELSPAELKEIEASIGFWGCGNRKIARRLFSATIVEKTVPQSVIDFEKSKLCPNQETGGFNDPFCQEHIVYKIEPQQARVITIDRK